MGICRAKKRQVDERCSRANSEGHRLSRANDANVCALLVGNNVEHLAEECYAYGADKVYIIEDPLLEKYTTDGFTKVMVDAMSEYKPEIVLYGATHIGKTLP